MQYDLQEYAKAVDFKELGVPVIDIQFPGHAMLSKVARFAASRYCNTMSTCLSRVHCISELSSLQAIILFSSTAGAHCGHVLQCKGDKSCQI